MNDVVEQAISKAEAITINIIVIDSRQCINKLNELTKAKVNLIINVHLKNIDNGISIKL